VKSDVEKVMAVLNEVDPEGLLKMGAPDDEYEGEARILLRRMVRYGQPLTAEYVRDVWLVMFGSGSGSQTSSKGRSISKIVEWVGDMPMRPAFQQVADGVNAIFHPRVEAQQ
jgi:hypothetical protein